MHDSSMAEMRNFVTKYLDGKTDLSIIDIGSRNVASEELSTYSYRALLSRHSWKYTGVDLKSGTNVDLVIQDEHDWREIATDSVDVVVSGQALEHVRYPWLWIKEVYRVLKPGGICCIIVPSAGWVHRFPLDCWRVHPDGLQALADWAGIKVISIHNNGLHPWADSVLIGRKE
jgi:SAM-dependent methyltransferase